MQKRIIHLPHFTTIFVFSAICVLFLFTSLYGQYITDVWTTTEGLPQNSVNAIIQTHDGYLWLGTYGGLTRFDGLAFTTIESPEQGLLSNRILSLCESHDGAIWIGTEGGGCARYFQGIYTIYSKKDGLLDDVVFSIIESLDSVIWVGTQNGVQCLVKGKIQLPPFGETLSRIAVRSLRSSRDGILWISSDQGVYRFINGKLELVLAVNPKAEKTPAFLYEDWDGSTWLRGKHGLLHFIDGRHESITNVKGLKDNYATTMMQDFSGEYWVGTISGGLYHSISRSSGNRMKAFPLPNGGQSIKIQTCFIDREGNRWIGTDGKGLLRIKDRLIDVISAKDGLTHEIVEAVFEDSRSSIWIGTNDGGLYRKKGNAIHQYTANNTLGPVWSLAEDAQGSLWVGTYGSGVFRYNKNGFKNFTTVQGLSDNDVMALYRDRSGAIWIGTNRGGVTILKDGKFKIFQKNSELLNTSVRTFLEDRSGAMWIGTIGGLNRYKNGAMTSYTTNNGLSHNYIRSVYEDRDSVLWIGTYGGGLDRLKDGVFTHYTMREGLYDNVVSAILEDDRENLWMSCNRGIYKVSLAQLNDFADGKIPSISCINYGMQDGLLIDEANGGFQPSAWKTKDGRLLFPTIKGLACIPLSKVKTNPAVPQVHIEQILINQVEYGLASRIEIPYGKNNIEIHYTALSFIDPQHIKFRFRLDGVHRNWFDVKQRRVAYFQSLPSGEYTFHVIAANNNGVWTNEDASFSFVVKPPFWERWYFRLSLVCALVLIGYVFYRRRKQRSMQVEQQQQLSERRLLDSMEEERKRIASELHDSIGQDLLIIKNRALLALEDIKNKKNTKEQLDEISETASLAIQETREISYNLRPYQIDRLGLKKAIESIFNRAAGTTAITFTSDIDPIDNLVQKEMEIHVYRIIQECVNNILKHANASKCDVVIKHWHDRLNIDVKDNGIGFNMTEKKSQESRGFGLHGILERTRLLGGAVKIESSPGNGTRILITIKTYERKTESN